MLHNGSRVKGPKQLNTGQSVRTAAFSVAAHALRPSTSNFTAHYSKRTFPKLANASASIRGAPQFRRQPKKGEDLSFRTLRVRAECHVELGEAGCPVGMIKPQMPGYVSSQFSIDTGDLLVSVSDGIAELTWPDEQSYFRSRLADACRQLFGQPLHEIARHVMSEVGNLAEDDQSILLMRLASDSEGL